MTDQSINFSCLFFVSLYRYGVPSLLSYSPYNSSAGISIKSDNPFIISKYEPKNTENGVGRYISLPNTSMI